MLPITQVEAVVAGTMVEEAPATVMPDVLDPRVVRGADLLDRTVPGWADLIDLDTFDLTDYRCCVCGQIGEKLGYRVRNRVFGWQFHWTLSKLGLDTEYTHGFNISGDDGEHDENWTNLQADWQIAIQARKTK